MPISEKQKSNIIEEYVRRENQPIAFSSELGFYAAVKSGDKGDVITQMKKFPFGNKNFAKLSDNHIQSLKYHFVVTAAMLARFCIEGGMVHKKAYEMSDFYICKADGCSSDKELIELHREMCLDYTAQMKRARKDTVFSKPIVESVDYISSHLHCRMTTEELAEYTGLNKSYFSRLFGKEIGIPPSRYIMLRKTEAAEDLLKYSEYSCSDIAELLAFSSQSHFISVFKKETGYTPLAYRNRFFNSTGLV